LDEAVKYWLDLAQYDLDTARVMLDGKRYLYVGFMCHQAIEKILKAYLVNKMKDNPPHIHNLLLLAKKSGIHDSFSEEQNDFMDMLEPLNIEARYPTARDKLIQSLNRERCQFIIENTEALYLWIKIRL
jgi:HEPN domain-containing protein